MPGGRRSLRSSPRPFTDFSSISKLMPSALPLARAYPVIEDKGVLLAAIMAPVWLTLAGSAGVWLTSRFDKFKTLGQVLR